jgi:hypothetical protein
VNIFLQRPTPPNFPRFALSQQTGFIVFREHIDLLFTKAPVRAQIFDSEARAAEYRIAHFKAEMPETIFEQNVVGFRFAHAKCLRPSLNDYPLVSNEIFLVCYMNRFIYVRVATLKRLGEKLASFYYERWWPELKTPRSSSFSGRNVSTSSISKVGRCICTTRKNELGLIFAEYCPRCTRCLSTLLNVVLPHRFSGERIPSRGEISTRIRVHDP